MSDWFDPRSESYHSTPIEQTTRTSRRQDGMFDARHRGIRMSRDPDYLAGYAWVEDMQKTRREGAPPTGSDGST